MRRGETIGRIGAGDWTIPSRFPLNKPFARGCVLAMVACGALAAPGLARAANPAGLVDVAGEVQSALNEADAVAPGVSAAAQPVVSQTLAAVSKASAAPPAPPAPPVSTQPPAAPPAPVVTTPPSGLEPLAAGPPAPLSTPAPSAPNAASAPLDPVAEAEAEVRTAIAEALAPLRTVGWQPQPTAAAAPAEKHSSPLAPSERPVPPSGTAGGQGASFTPAAREPVIALEALRVAPAGPDSRARAQPRGGERAERPAGAVVPQRPPPPVPPPQRPDLGSPSQGGGSGPLMPLVVAALAAAFALFGFQRQTRRLPLSAFRKPRRVVLPVWHPG
jgi:hypothetical protein